MARRARPKLKTYAIISGAVEQGIAYGYRRAHKHVEIPTEEYLFEAIREAVMSSLHNVLNLDDR